MATIQAGAFHRRNKQSTAFEQKTIDATVGGIALTGATYGTARYAEITVDSADIRFTCDGTPPTAILGHQVGAGYVIELDSHEDIVNFRAIRTGSVSAKINATYQEMKLTA
jgi:hypothetical protein